MIITPKLAEVSIYVDDDLNNRVEPLRAIGSVCNIKDKLSLAVSIDVEAMRDVMTLDPPA